MINVSEQINAVRREVGGRTLEAGEARVVTIGQSYDATIEDVWDVCTNPERIPRWFLPVSGDLRLGGRYQFEGNAGGIGWDMGLLGLAGHLSGKPAVDPADGAAWAASSKGRRFMAQSSDRWCEASIAAGTDPVAARAAADRTIAAYTGTGG